jgi:TonB-linked SusC/RagA family outer membrane protein
MLIFLSIGIGAQQTVRGTVTDENGEAVIGATILVKGTDSGTITDWDGTYEVNVPGEDAVLVFSYIGMETQEIAVGTQSVIDLVLGQDTQVLEEVVVIGYGIQKKKVSTGAISKLTAKNIEGIKVQDVQTALEGQVSGLIVSESSGQPGAEKSMLIRGVSTNGDNSPLYLVDGMAVSGINNINPGDIESVDVLKDAASTAIYGARGANGVVIITTKKGDGGKGSITYDGFVSQSQPWKLPEMLSSEDYVLLTREKFRNGGQESALNNLGFPNEGDDVPNTNWMDEIFDPANVQSHRLSATVGNSLISMEYWDQKGVVGGEKSRYKRYGIRLNSTKEVTDFLTIGENIYLNRVENPTIGVNDAFGTVIADAFAYDPITPVNNDEKDFGFEQSKWVQKEYINPLSRLFISSNGDGHADQLVGNVYAELKPLKHFRIRSDFGTDFRWNKWRNSTPEYFFHAAARNVTNDVSQGYEFGQSFQFENYINYNNQFGLHSLDIVLGTSYREESSETAGGDSQNIPIDVQFSENWQWLDSGQDTLDLTYGSRGVKYSLISYFGRALYDYKGTYLLTATLRRDGSSNFGANNRWGLFPSFSLGWVVSNESFFNVDPISFLKLRGSWGVNGNDRIDPLAYAARVENVFTYAFGNPHSLLTGAALATPPNPNIKWEESVQLDIGLDIKFYKDKLGLEVDYYVKNTKDLLMDQVIPGYIGATNNPTSNLGEIENRGIEAALSYRTLIGNDLRLNTSFNYTTFTNNVINVAGEAGFISGWGWPVRNTPITRMTEDFPVGHFVGYLTDGIFKSDNEVFSHLNSEGDLLQPKAKGGDIRFVDVNKDGVIDSDDITDIGSPWPKHIFGLSIGGSYKGLDMNMVFSAKLGHQIYRTYERSDVTYTNYQTIWLDRWTPDNTEAEFPRLISTDPNNNQRPSDFYVEDASFLRLRNLQIGYTIPDRFTQKAKLNNVRLYLSANNLITITNYSGFDPDIGTTGWILDTGIDKGYYPSNRTVGFGLQIGI